MAHQNWDPDGTQPPPPPQAWNDPVAGLVTGSEYGSEPFRIDVATPVTPDPEEVRRAVDAAMSEEETISPRKVPTLRKAQSTDTPPMGMPGLVPRNPRPGWPRPPSVRQLAGLRPRLPGGRQGASRPARPTRLQGSTLGIGAIVALLLVFTVIAVTFLNSLLGSIAGLFN